MWRMEYSPNCLYYQSFTYFQWLAEPNPNEEEKVRFLLSRLKAPMGQSNVSCETPLSTKFFTQFKEQEPLHESEHTTAMLHKSEHTPALLQEPEHAPAQLQKCEHMPALLHESTYNWAATQAWSYDWAAARASPSQSPCQDLREIPMPCPRQHQSLWLSQCQCFWARVMSWEPTYRPTLSSQEDNYNIIEINSYWYKEEWRKRNIGMRRSVALILLSFKVEILIVE